MMKKKFSQGKYDGLTEYMTTLMITARDWGHAYKYN